MAVKPTTARLIGMKSGNTCAKPGCGKPLTEPGTPFDPEVIIGQIAHIVSQADTGPRADPSMSDDERDAPENLVFLCREHHAIADRQENTYTVEEMRKWKVDHEAQVARQMEILAGRMTFAELEIVADAVATTPQAGAAGFTLTAVRAKMSKNALTTRVDNDMSVGMLSADIVKDYVADRAKTQSDFPDRLRAGFVVEYNRLVATGLRGDDLFIALRAFAAAPHHDLMRQVAGLAVLVHLFRICEVFEP